MTKGPATRNDFVNAIVNDRALDAIFATLKAIVDDEKSTMKSRRYRHVWQGLKKLIIIIKLFKQ